MKKSNPSTKQQTGKWGEDFSEELLKLNGFQILERNFRTQYGEIDIIAQKGERLVFVEVKTRTNRVYGLPEESITRTKQEHLRASVEVYFQNHPEFDGEWQIDVIALEKKPGDEIPEIEWFENAVV